MIVIGGWREFSPDTSAWALSLQAGQESWSPLDASGESPGAARGSTAIYDPVAHRIIAFGGFHARLGLTNAVWELRLSEPVRWRRLTPEGLAPGSRSGHTSVYDPQRRRLLAFGGNPPDTAVWALSLDSLPTWSRLQVAGPGPSPGYSHAAILDELRDRMILFRGYNPSETWILELAGLPRWRKLDTALRPGSAYGSPTAIHDREGDRMMLLGLAEPSPYGSSSDYVWHFSLDSEKWQAHYPLVSSTSMGGVYDPLGRRGVLFGGRSADGIFLNRTWALDPRETSFTLPELDLVPPPRRGHSAVYDPSQDRMLLLGGATGGGPQYVSYDSRLWQLEFRDSPRWSPLALDPWVAGREGCPVVIDARRQRVLGLGGFELRYPGCHPQHDPMIPSYRHDAWALTMAGAPSPSLPTGRHSQGHSAVLDPVRDRLITFGGYTTTAVLCDHIMHTQTSFDGRLRVLELNDPRAWSILDATGDVPPAQGNHLAVYDEDRHRIVMIGGFERPHPHTLITHRDKVWILDLEPEVRWQLVQPLGDFPDIGLGPAAVAYDPVRERILVYGPDSRYGYGAGTVWALPLVGAPVWERLSPAGSPPGDILPASAAYDSRRDRLVLFGGEDSDTRFLTWGTPLRRVGLVVHPGGPDGLPAPVHPDSRGLTRVAVLAATDFEPADLDLSSVVVSGARPARRGNGTPMTESVDVDRDGLRDLVIHVPTDSMALNPSRPVRLDALTRSGLPIRGLVSPRVVPRARADVKEAHRTASSAAFGLVGARQNPALGGPLEVLFELPSSERARLSLFDVAGRRVAEETIETPSVGSHVVRFEARDRLPAGLYFVRLEQGARGQTTRVVILD